jgi:serine/threonine protein kinase
MTNVGSYLGNYRLLSQLPHATHEDIYVAEHTNLTGSPVLVRVWHTVDLQTAFLQELQTLTELQHVHILPFLEAGVAGEDVYLVTAYHQPPLETLREHLQRQGSHPLPAQEALTLLNQIGLALQYAHHHNVIHRQLTPDRILLGPVGALVSDFGLVHAGDTTLRKMSQPMKLRDQYVYLAPEQLQNQVSPASDQYALGAIAYELYTGQQPPPANQPLIPPEQLNSALPSGLVQAIKTAMAPVPSERYPDVAAFVNALLNAEESIVTLSNEDTIVAHPAEVLVGEQLPTSFTPSPPPAYTPSWAGLETIAPQQGSVAQPISGPQPSAGTGSQTIYPGMYNPQYSPQPGGQYYAQASPSNGKSFKSLFNGGKLQKTSAFRDFLAKRARLIAIVLLVVLVPLLIYYGLTVLPASAATITITPMSKRLTQTYHIDAVAGTPDNTQHQAPAYTISFTTPPKTQTVATSGRGHQNATAAKGMLTFSQVGQNSDIDTGQTISGSDGIQIITDQAFTINVGQTVQIPAHAVNAGSCCNIGTDDFDFQVGVINPITKVQMTTVFVENQQPFSGGQDAFDYNFVKQSDIDRVANAFVSQLTKDAQAGVEKQVKTNQQPLSDIQCSPNIKPDHKVNDRVDNVTVAVTVTCSREYFVPQEVQNAAEAAFKDDAQTKYGSNYQLSGNAVMGMPQVFAPLANGTVTLQVKVDGIWVYHFSDSQQQQIIQNIVGKPQSSANDVLQHTIGVNRATIATSGGIGSALPTSPPNIKFVVVNIPGLQAG